MATIADLNVRIGAITKGLEQGLSRAERNLQRTGRKFSNVGNELTFAVSAPLAAVGIAAVNTAGKFELYQNSLAAMMGSAEAAKTEMENLRIAALDPGLNFEQAMKGSVRLQAVGMSADMARRALSSMGNALTLAGGTASDLDGVTLALTQIISKGKVSAEEINQLAERVPQIRKVMKEAFGTADTEQLQAMGISSEEFVTKIIGEFEKLPKAQGGLQNSIENLGQTVTTFLSDLGNEINKALNLKQVFADLGDSLQNVLNWFRSLTDEQKKNIVTWGLTAVAAGPALKIFGTMLNTLAIFPNMLKTVISGFTAASGVVLRFADSFRKMDLAMKATTLGYLTIAIGVAVMAYQQFTGELEKVSAKTEAYNSTTNEAMKATIAQRNEVDSLMSVLRDNNTTLEQREAALKRLNEISPEYFGNLTTEKDNLFELAAAQAKYTEQILATARAKAASTKLEQLEADKLDLMEKLKQAQAAEQIKMVGTTASKVGWFLKNTFSESSSEIQAQIDHINNLQAEYAKLASTVGMQGAGSLTGSGGMTQSFTRNPKGGKSKGERPDKLTLFYDTQREGIETFDIGVRNMTESTLPELYTRLNEGHTIAEGFTEQLERLAESSENLDNVLFESTNTMAQYAQMGGDSLRSLGKAAMDGAKDVVRSMIYKAVATQIAKIIGAVPFPLNVAIASAGAAAVTTLFNKALGSIPAFAEGGIVTGPTLAMVGDNPSGTEMILPLEKAASFFGQMGGASEVRVTGQLRASGRDLLVVIENEQMNRRRRGGV